MADYTLLVGKIGRFGSPSCSGFLPREKAPWIPKIGSKLGPTVHGVSFGIVVLGRLQNTRRLQLVQ
jgi:hypothetical protein